MGKACHRKLGPLRKDSIKVIRKTHSLEHQLAPPHDPNLPPVGLYPGCLSSESALFDDPVFPTGGGDGRGGAADSVVEGSSIGAAVIGGDTADMPNGFVGLLVMGDLVRSGMDLAY